MLRNLEGDHALRLQRAQSIIRELRAGNVYTFVNELKVPQEDNEHWKVGACTDKRGYGTQCLPSTINVKM